VADARAGKEGGRWIVAYEHHSFPSDAGEALEVSFAPPDPALFAALG
jgi:hypothetical protein